MILKIHLNDLEFALFNFIKWENLSNDHLLFDSILPKVQSSEYKFAHVYDRPDWYTYDNLLYSYSIGDMTNVDKALICKHLAVAFVLSPDKEKLHLPAIYYSVNFEWFTLELFFSVMASGEFPRKYLAR